MRWNKKAGLAVLLIGAGGLILLSKVGIPVGSTMGIVIPAVMVILGWNGIKHGRTGVGWVVLTIGMIALACALSGIAVLLLPLILIASGWFLLKGPRKVY